MTWRTSSAGRKTRINKKGPLVSRADWNSQVSRPEWDTFRTVAGPFRRRRRSINVRLPVMRGYTWTTAESAIPGNYCRCKYPTRRINIRLRGLIKSEINYLMALVSVACQVECVTARPFPSSRSPGYRKATHWCGIYRRACRMSSQSRPYQKYLIPSPSLLLSLLYISQNKFISFISRRYVVLVISSSPKNVNATNLKDYFPFQENLRIMRARTKNVPVRFPMQFANPVVSASSSQQPREAR